MDTPFTQWLITQMKKKGWSQADLARHTGLTRQAIANYVDGRVPQNDSIVILARVFRFPPEALFRIVQGLPETPEADPWVDEMAHKLRQISPSLRGVAETVIESLVEGDTSAVNRKTAPRHKSSTP